MNKKSNVLSSNLSSKQCKSNMTTYTRLKRKELILQHHMQKGSMHRYQERDSKTYLIQLKITDHEYEL